MTQNEMSYCISNEFLHYKLQDTLTCTVYTVSHICPHSVRAFQQYSHLTLPIALAGILEYKVCVYRCKGKYFVAAPYIQQVIAKKNP